ncbi:MAG: hypothetical protein CRU78_05475 [Candidatus Accumulibacter phosphatis]|uniref:Uncharacterized protein n=1 Tax=Candidatus Accumulibacter phosphatis TaxID=327160 RepID=A0A6A7RSE0_9PROT|nr:hypothetical protein [Candidatus Accumulibacter phosphatis]
MVDPRTWPISSARFATDICDAQAVDFLGARNHRKTYPFCSGGLKSFATVKDLMTDLNAED